MSLGTQCNVAGNRSGALEQQSSGQTAMPPGDNWEELGQKDGILAGK